MIRVTRITFFVFRSLGWFPMFFFCIAIISYGRLTVVWTFDFGILCCLKDILYLFCFQCLPMLRRILEYLTAFVHLLYPRLCLVCGEPLVTGERHVCSGCLLAFPYNYLGGGKLERKLNRVFPVEGVYALFLYHHGSPYRKIIHALKYHSRKEVGLWLGHMLAVKFLKD